MDMYRDGDTMVGGGERAGDAEDVEQGGEIGGFLCTGGKFCTHYRLSCFVVPYGLTQVFRAWYVCNKIILV